MLIGYRRVGEDGMFMVIFGTIVMLFSTKNEDGSRSYLKMLGFICLGLLFITMIMGLKPTYELEGPIYIVEPFFLDVYVTLSAFYAIYGCRTLTAATRCQELYSRQHFGRVLFYCRFFGWILKGNILIFLVSATRLALFAYFLV